MVMVVATKFHYSERYINVMSQCNQISGTCCMRHLFFNSLFAFPFTATNSSVFSRFSFNKAKPKDKETKEIAT